MKKNIIIGIICGLLTGVVVACVLFFIFKKEEDEMAKEVATQMLNEITEDIEEELEQMEEDKAKEVEEKITPIGEAFKEMYGMTVEESADELRSQIVLTYEIYKEKYGDYTVKELCEMQQLEYYEGFTTQKSLCISFIKENFKNENLYIWDSYSPLILNLETIETKINPDLLIEYYTVDIYYKKNGDNYEFVACTHSEMFEIIDNKWSYLDRGTVDSDDGWELLYSLP